MLSSINQYIKKIEKAEETLRFNERFLASIFDSIQDGLCILDTNDEVLRVNPFYGTCSSPQAMPLVGKKCYEVYQRLGPALRGVPGLRRTMGDGASRF